MVTDGRRGAPALGRPWFRATSSRGSMTARFRLRASVSYGDGWTPCRKNDSLGTCAADERSARVCALGRKEHGPLQLVQHARRAESGFTFAVIYDHFHPWIDAQGQSPFVWSVLGGIAEATTTLQIGTGVTCPLIRIHPAIVAHAAATSAARCCTWAAHFLGVGTGENLNEHVLGDRWPPTFVRREMLREAIDVIRGLLARGTH